jgi:5'(3')-deoxyribonucleotidase
MLTIGCDVDGVVADLHTPWLFRYNRDYNDDIKASDITGWGVHEFVKPKCGKRIYEYIEDPSLYEVVFPTSNEALNTILKIKLLGHRVVYLTTSTLGSSGAKFKWLKRWGFLEDMKDYIEVTDKNLIKADILIDDRLETTEGWYRSGNFPILFKQPWNKQIIRPYLHTDNWDEIYNTIVALDIFDDGMPQ